MSDRIQHINIFWGADKAFEEATHSIDDMTSLATVLAHISEKEIKIKDANLPLTPPMKIENLIILTDDYGGVMEWAILGFSNNILRHSKVEIHNLWLCNPPDKIYETNYY